MRQVVMAVVVMVALCATPAGAQTAAGAPTHPDFSGHWILVPGKTSEPAAPNAGAFSDEFVIAIRGTSLILDSKINMSTARRLYDLTGAPAVSPGSVSTSTSTAKWQGDTLVLTTRSTLNASTSAAGTVETSRALSLAADGTLAIIVTTKSVSGTQTARSVYRKGDTPIGPSDHRAIGPSEVLVL